MSRCLEHPMSTSQRGAVLHSDIGFRRPLPEWETSLLLAVTSCPDELRKKNRRRMASFSELDNRAMQALPPRFRAVVLLRCTGHLSIAEIGQERNIPVATVKTCFSCARREHQAGVWAVPIVA